MNIVKILNAKDLKFNPELKYPKITLITGILISCLSIFIVFRVTDIHQNELIEVKGTLKKDPKLNHTQSRGVNYYDYDFKLNEFLCTFKIMNDEYRSLDKNAIDNEVKVGDTISLYILPEDGQKVKNTIEMIQTFGIAKDSKKMYNLEYRNQLYKNDSKSGWLIFGIGIIICIYPLVGSAHIAHWILAIYAIFYFVGLFFFAYLHV